MQADFMFPAAAYPPFFSARPSFKAAETIFFPPARPFHKPRAHQVDYERLFLKDAGICRIGRRTRD